MKVVEGYLLTCCKTVVVISLNINFVFVSKCGLLLWTDVEQLLLDLQTATADHHQSFMLLFISNTTYCGKEEVNSQSSLARCSSRLIIPCCVNLIGNEPALKHILVGIYFKKKKNQPGLIEFREMITNCITRWWPWQNVLRFREKATDLNLRPKLIKVEKKS